MLDVLEFQPRLQEFVFPFCIQEPAPEPLLQKKGSKMIKPQLLYSQQFQLPCAHLIPRYNSFRLAMLLENTNDFLRSPSAILRVSWRVR